MKKGDASEVTLTRREIDDNSRRFVSIHAPERATAKREIY